MLGDWVEDQASDMMISAGTDRFSGPKGDEPVDWVFTLRDNESHEQGGSAMSISEELVIETCERLEEVLDLLGDYLEGSAAKCHEQASEVVDSIVEYEGLFNAKFDSPARKNKAEEEFEKLNLYSGDANDTFIAVLRVKKVTGTSEKEVLKKVCKKLTSGDRDLVFIQNITSIGELFNFLIARQSREELAGARKQSSLSRVVATNSSKGKGSIEDTSSRKFERTKQSNLAFSRRCYVCGLQGHMARDCNQIVVRRSNASTYHSFSGLTSEGNRSEGKPWRRDPNAMDVDLIVEENFSVFQLCDSTIAPVNVAAVKILAKISSTPVWLQLDTGAGLNIMGRAMADKLGLGPGVPTPRRIRPVGLHESFEKGISSDCSEAERGDLEKLITVYEGVFAETLEDLGAAEVEACDFELLDNRPIKQKPYRIAHSLRNEVNEQLDEMIRKGIVIPSESPYCFPMVVVRKTERPMDVDVVLATREKDIDSTSGEELQDAMWRSHIQLHEMAESTSSLEWITLLGGQLPSRGEVWCPDEISEWQRDQLQTGGGWKGELGRSALACFVGYLDHYNRAIGRSPAELVYGKRLMTPAIWGNESITSLESLEGTVFDETDWLNKSVTFRKQAYEQSVKNKNALVQTYQPKQGWRQFEVGDKVLYYKGTTDSGFGPIVDVPNEVTRIFGSGVYKITLRKGGKIPSSAVRLKKYLEPYEGTRSITSLESLEGTVFDETDWLNKSVTFRKQAYEQSVKNKNALVQTYQPKQGWRQFEVGDKVLYYKGTTDSGFGPIVDVPNEVTRIFGSGVYKITLRKGGKIPSSADSAAEGHSTEEPPKNGTIQIEFKRRGQRLKGGD
ncbi:hypothetical protein AYI69_g2823 [Smittium culicis]|uniref:CCHC-type domain-containing protein n=1 Tax=Smittium culicis TaxID=133412 RepID=A0A1R1YLE4_9FUNG|nr:hypothetical protein AYI69_g2823 [Smittium culicis]